MKQQNKPAYYTKLKSPKGTAAANTFLPIATIRRFLISLFISCSVVLIASGYFLYRHQAADVRNSQIDYLRAIAEMKASQMVAWRKHITNTVLLNATGLMHSQALDLLKHPDDLLLKDELVNRMNLFVQREGYESIILAGTDARFLASSDDALRILDENAKKLIQQATQTNQLVFGDFYNCATCRQIHLDIVSPVRDTEGRPVAAFIFREDPHRFLYPQIQSWPVRSSSAETLLLRMEKDHALVLNPLRLSNNTPLTLRLPPTADASPSVIAAVNEGKTGIMEGEDYRGRPVVADVHPIDGSSWIMVVKMDKAELFLDSHHTGIITSGFVIILLLLIGCGAGFFYKHYSKRMYQDLLEIESQRLALMERSHVTLQSIGDAVIATDMQGRVTQMNRMAETFTGWREADAIGKPLPEIFIIVNEITRQAPENPVERVIQKGVAVGLANHTVLISKDGAEIPIADSASPIRISTLGSEGEMIGVVLVFRDQTAERQAQEAIQREKDNLQAILSASPICLILLDETATIRQANASGERLSGKSLSQIIDSRCGDLLGCANRLEKNCGCGQSSQCASCKLNADIRHHFSSRQSFYNQELEITTDVGERRWYQFSIEPVLIDNQHLGLVALHDISGRKKTENQLLLEKQKLQSALHESECKQKELDSLLQEVDDWANIFQHAKWGIALISTNDEYPIKTANSFFAEMHGRELPEVIGMPLSRLAAMDSRELLNEHLISVKEHSGHEAFLINSKRVDGSTFSSQMDITFLTGKKHGYYILNMMDVSDRVSLENQLVQAMKMESVGRLAGGVAHDFNNMLGVISCHSEMIMEDIDASHPLHTSILAIQEATRRSASVVRQLLAFARKQVANPQILNINNSISSMLTLLQRIIGENITLVWNPGEFVWNVNIDPSQIDQILANLLVNAKDAIASVGAITIETKNVTLDSHYCADHAGALPGEYVMVSVADTGTGMEQGIVDHIFEPFFTTKPTDKGTGLGLATVYGVVKQNKGYIDVNSEPGKGTVFMLYFPRAKEKKDLETEKTGRDGKQAGTETLLLVEDEEEILHSTALFLKRYGYKVLSAAKPSEAIQIRKEYAGRIHLLITDVVMPEMNGRELFDVLQKENPDLKCLYLSGYTDDIIASQGITDEDVHLLPKPFSMKQLNRKIRELVGG